MSQHQLKAVPPAEAGEEDRKKAAEVVNEFLGIMDGWLKPDDYERLEHKANEFLFEGVKRVLKQSKLSLLEQLEAEGPGDKFDMTRSEMVRLGLDNKPRVERVKGEVSGFNSCNTLWRAIITKFKKG